VRGANVLITDDIDIIIDTTSRVSQKKVPPPIMVKVGH
jgi:hypothetical protein